MEEEETVFTSAGGGKRRNGNAAAESRRLNGWRFFSQKVAVDGGWAAATDFGEWKPRNVQELTIECNQCNRLEPPGGGGCWMNRPRWSGRVEKATKRAAIFVRLMESAADEEGSGGGANWRGQQQQNGKRFSVLPTLLLLLSFF